MYGFKGRQSFRIYRELHFGTFQSTQLVFIIQSPNQYFSLDLWSGIHQVSFVLSCKYTYILQAEKNSQQGTTNPRHQVATVCQSFTVIFVFSEIQPLQTYTTFMLMQFKFNSVT